jgi:molecular chaperone GrpE
VTAADDENDGQATERVVIRDRRKIDQKSEADEAADAKAASAPGAHRAADPEEEVVAEVEDPKAGLGAELEALRGELDERTHDLQRITAEYANYRKRVDRDRGAAAEQTTGAVLTALLPVLDDVDRAREHGDLVGPFASVAESLTAVTGKLGLAAFGEKGDPFDPNRHEAVAHQTSADVTEATCIEVMRRGYTLGERLLRPALVAVADPE